jgi:hypothetical protein
MLRALIRGTTPSTLLALLRFNTSWAAEVAGGRAVVSLDRVDVLPLAVQGSDDGVRHFAPCFRYRQSS